MLITSSGGKRFRSVPSQCKDDPFRSWVTTTDGNELWVVCAGFPATSSRDFSPKALYVSEDGGLTWSQNAITQAGVKLPTAGMQAAIVSTKPHSLLLEVDPNPILMTSDSGSNWAQVATSPTEGVFRFRFFNQTTGWAMGTLGGIWWTADGGLNWSRVTSYDAH